MRLICINDIFSPEQIKIIPNRVVLNEIYTLRKRVHTSFGLGYLLHEITNPLADNGEEMNFSPKRFRKLDEEENLLEIDISKEIFA